MKIPQDVRFSLRLLRKSPGFTIVAILTLAVGIGANAIVFAVMNSLILNPLNVPAANSFYEIERLSDYSAEQSYPDYIDLRDRNHSFNGLSAFAYAQAGLDTGKEPLRVWIVQASGNYFDVLGVQPYLGRFFHGSEDHGPNSMPYIVLSYAYWHAHFHDDSGVVGRVVQLNKHPFTILGVARPEFHGTLLFFSPDLFTPMVNQQQVEGGADVLNARGNRWVYMTMGHLKPGVTPAQAGADIDSIWLYLQQTYPKEHLAMKFKLARPGLYGDAFGGPVKAFLTALMLLAGLILLAACANLGSLFAARAADRSREVALRLALGSSRKLIFRQLFTEATLISLTGGTLGVLVSIALLRGLASWRPFPQFPVNLPVNADIKVYTVALLLALASGFLFGAVPVRQILRINSYEIIKSGATGVGRRRLTVRDLLLVAQITICAVLVTSSMVAVRGLTHSMNGSYGFEPHNTLLVNVNLSMAGYSGESVLPMQKRMIDAMSGLPGVTSVGLLNTWPPLTGDSRLATVFTEQTADLSVANAAATAVAYDISPEYFQAAGTNLLSGRVFSWHDDKSSTPVAVVNVRFAERIFGSVNNAIGRFYKIKDGTRIQVVGVVQDGKYGFFTEKRQSAMFLPILQSAFTLQGSSSETWLILRTNTDTTSLAGDVRSKFRDLDAGLPVFTETWNAGMSLPLFPARMAAMSLGVLGALGGILSVTGIFGVAASAVSKRRRELGIRVALGAKRSQVSSAVLARPFKLLAFGSATGLLLGFLATQVLSAIVYDATARDPLVLSGVVLAMLLIGLLGTWIPARRALSIDASRLLRQD